MLLNKKLGNLLVIHEFVAGLNQLADVAYRNGNDFFGGGKAGENLAHAIFAQRSHSEFTGALSQHQSRAALVDHMTDFIVDHKNFEYAHAALVTDLAALLASNRFHYLGIVKLPGFNAQRTQFRLT